MTERKTNNEHGLGGLYRMNTFYSFSADADILAMMIIGYVSFRRTGGTEMLIPSYPKSWGEYFESAHYY